MPSKFGAGPYGVNAYSRNKVYGYVVIAEVSSLPVAPMVRHAAAVVISVVTETVVTSRLLWDHIPVAPCEGAWAPLVDSPCRRAA